MGYELDRLMRQFGVSTPTLSYSGAQQPIRPGDLTTGATDTQKTEHDALLAKYNADLPQYTADKAAFDRYSKDFQDRVQNTPMYSDPQFNNGQQQRGISNNPSFIGPVIQPAHTSGGYWPTTLAQPKYGQAGWIDLLAQKNQMQSNPGASTGDTAQAVTPTSLTMTPGSASLDPESWLAGAGGETGGWLNERFNNYCRGGAVKKGYADGGLAEMADDYETAPPDDAAENSFANDFVNEPRPTAAAMPMKTTQPGARPSLDLAAMLAKYQPDQTSYGADLMEARERARKESSAFEDMLQKAISNQGDSAPSKAEMYFRLASAFGAPTKTGSFGESLGKVGEAMGQYQKDTREAARQQRNQALQLGLQAQQGKLASAKEDVTALRGLAGGEMKDKREITKELIKDYIKSGEPQSSAGKQAVDEGLQPGTPAFQTRVAKIAEMNIEKQTAQIAAALAGVAASQANVELAGERLKNQQHQQSRLTPGELKLKTDAEDKLASVDASLGALNQAYKLNPHTFDSSLIDTAQRKMLEAAGSKDEKLRATRTMENLLTEKALNGLKLTFGGNPTEGERKILLDVQGIGAKSIEERADIMRNANRALKVARARQQKRLSEINAGSYRDTQKTAEEE